VPRYEAKGEKTNHKILRLRFPTLEKTRWTLLRSGYGGIG